MTRHGAGALRAKLQIRENVLAAIGAENARVFEAYCGPGELYHGVWHKAASYTGVDKAWFRDARTCFVADATRVMRAVDLTQFSVLDVDPFGSPYEALVVWAARRPVQPGERIGITITDGSGLRLRMGYVPDAFALLAGVRRHMPGVARNHEELVDRAIASLARRMGCRVEKQWRAKSPRSSQLVYCGLVLVGG